MGRVTYAEQNHNNKLEDFEWDYLWWEHTEKEDACRVLYVGDSISFGTYPRANTCAEGRILFHNLATSKAVDNPFLLELLRLYANQPGEYQAVLFNSGLHGWHLEDTTEYLENYEKVMQGLKEIFPKSQIVVLTSTRVADKERSVRVQKRNESVKKVADKLGLSIIDLHAISEQCSDLQSDDGVHFTEEGYVCFAKYIIEQIEKMIT